MPSRFLHESERGDPISIAQRRVIARCDICAPYVTCAVYFAELPQGSNLHAACPPLTRSLPLSGAQRLQKHDAQ